MEALYSSLATFQVIFQLPCGVLVVSPLDFISQTPGVLVVNVKDFLKYPFFFNIAIVISFYDSPFDIPALSGVNLCLARDFLWYPQANF
jgi:hypothetical protein